MVNKFILIMSLCSFMLGLLACSVLWFSNKSHRHANHLLTMSLFSLTMAMLATFLYVWNIDVYAYIYRFPSPLYYLIMPGAYLYVRTVVNDETKLRKWDVIHFLPAVLRFIELFPFYFTSYAYRKSLVEQLSKDVDNPVKFSEGVLPPYYHTTLITVLGCIYLGLMIFNIWKARRIKGIQASKSYFRSFKWVQVFTLLIALNAVPLFFILFSSRTFFISGSQLLMATICVCFLVINFYLFFQPEILYGIPQLKLKVNSHSPVLPLLEEIQKHPAENGVTIEDVALPEAVTVQPALANLESYKPILELYLATAKPFLNQGYTIYDLSRDAGIPQHHLSALLNRVYGMRFNEFMNRMRIDYIAENFSNLQWDNLTLEGIAKEAGFNSRTTFFNSIKKTTGLAPSEFIENIKQSHTVPKVRKE